LTDGRFDLFRSHARFLDHLTIRLNDGQELWADKYIIATGSIVQEPKIKGLDTVGYMTSDDILSASDLAPYDDGFGWWHSRL
jgi:pyruvate/2-oxoglutarate dehydrogenase complex dihydrolipoamide dehydrogenase (E3) component